MLFCMYRNGQKALFQMATVNFFINQLADLNKNWSDDSLGLNDLLTIKPQLHAAKVDTTLKLIPDYLILFLNMPLEE